MQSRAGHPASSYCHRKNTGAASGFLSRMGASGLHLWGRCREEADLIWFCLFECLGLIALDVGRVGFGCVVLLSQNYVFIQMFTAYHCSTVAGRSGEAGKYCWFAGAREHLTGAACERVAQ